MAPTDTAEMIRAGAEIFMTTERDVIEPANFKHISACRKAIMVAMHQRGLTYSAIARRMKRNHATVMYAVRTARERMQQDAGYAEKVSLICAAGDFKV